MGLAVAIYDITQSITAIMLTSQLVIYYNIRGEILVERAENAGTAKILGKFRPSMLYWFKFWSKFWAELTKKAKIHHGENRMNLETHTPRYIQIKAHILKQIATMKPNAIIPSEAALAAEFHVSRGTVKQAVMDLVYEGVLYRVQGKGTFISPMRIPRTFHRLPSFTTDIGKMGLSSHNEILRFGPVLPSEEMRRFLGLDADEEVVRYKRLVSVDGEPIVVVSSYLSPRAFPDFGPQDIFDSLYSSLQMKYSRVPTKAQDTYSIVNASPKTAELLHLAENTPIFFSVRRAYLQDMTPAEYVESYIRSDRYQLNITIGIDEISGAELAQEEDGEKGGSSGATHYGIGFRNIITQGSIT